MSFFFPVHRPRLGLSFTERGIALVELRRGWGKPGIARVRERPLPNGVLRVSATEPNLLDRKAVEVELKSLLRCTSERTVAVCLPDHACHLAVFPFKTVPPRERERDSILRWRFEHEEHVLVGDARILHRVFSVREAAKTPVIQDDQITAYVLAMAMKRCVLDQYEQVCEQMGVLPVSINCAAMWLFDFYRSVMTQAAELFFVHQAPDSMTFFAIRKGIPVFCRTKSWRHEKADVTGEIRCTMQFYEDLLSPGEAAIGPVSGPIYMVGAGYSEIEGFSDQITSSQTRTAGKPASSWTPQLIFPDWKARVSEKNRTVFGEEWLYALACVGGR